MKSLTFALVLTLAMVCLCTANIHPAENFDAKQDARILRLAVSNRNEDKITNVLTKRSAKQRLAIADAYKELYRTKLIDDLEDELTGNFEELMMAMVTPLPDFYALELFRDVEPLTFHTGALIDILCSSSNAEIHAIEAAFDRQQPRAVGKLPYILNAFYQGIAFRVVNAVFELKRNDSQEVDEVAAIADAKVIYELGECKHEESRSFNDDRKLEEIFITRSAKQMQKIINVYQKLYGHVIEKAFEDRGFGSVMEEGFLNMVHVFRDIPKHFASRLYEAMEGMGTDDRKLIRVLVGRSEIDLDEIKAAFQAMYGESLAQWIEADTSGDYMNALLAIAKA